jgi:cytochrome c-type biogenesis protein CcmH
MFESIKRLSLKNWPIPALVLILLFSATIGALAQQESPPVTDDQVNAVAKGLYCPVCENIPLDVCGTQACAQWRELIREKLGQGWTDTQIKNYFVQQYGDRVLAEPPTHGINWLAYLVPPAAFLLGAFILVKALRSWKAPLPAVPPTDPGQPQAEAPQDEYIARLEEELKRTE